VFLRFTIVRWPMLNPSGMGGQLMGGMGGGGMSNPWAPLAGMGSLNPMMGGMALGSNGGMGLMNGASGLSGFDAASSFPDSQTPPFLLPPQPFMQPFMPHAALGRGW